MKTPAETIIVQKLIYETHRDSLDVRLNERKINTTCIYIKNDLLCVLRILKMMNMILK